MNNLIENDPRKVLEMFGLKYVVIGVHYCLVKKDGSILRRNVTKGQMSAYAQQLIDSVE